MNEIANIITSQYFGVIGAIAIVLSPFLLKKNKDINIQAIVVTAGMLGTFLGIVAGLWLFDTSNIDESIPGLLGGLKTAFLTSIAGITASLVIQLAPSVYGVLAVEEEKSQGETLSDVLKELKLLNSNISGDNDTTLLTQIQKLRTSLVDKQEELNKSFKEFAEKMIDDNTQSLVEALENVMRDFNAKINEQFGDNFKQLNEAVGKILEWQENYKEQVELSTNALNAAGKALSQTSNSMGSAVKDYEKLATISKELKEQLETMGGFISGIKALSDTLTNSGENIKKEMQEIMQKSLQELGQNLAAISEKLASDYSSVQKAMESMARNT